MKRRAFLSIALLSCVSATWASGQSFTATKKFVFKIRTKSGGIVGNILIEGKDMFAAVAKLKKRYPGCEILEGREK